MDGHLTLFEGGEPKVDVVNTHGGSGLHRNVYSIVPFSRGFICGCQSGVLTIYERLDESSYRKTREVPLPEENLLDIINMAITPNEEMLLVTLKNAQMYYLSMSSNETKVPNLTFLHS
jgi:hypothetical protein